MSGETALKTRYDRGPACGCSREESELCRRLASTFVRCAGAVAVGEKPAALFSFQPQPCPRECASLPAERPCVCSVICALATGLSPYGIRLQVVGEQGARLELMVWRPELVCRILGDEATCAFLEQSGYDASSAESLVSGIRHRLVEYHQKKRTDFPHEVGILLGYPLEDVQGYLAGDKVTCRGPWRAYGDAATARRRFEQVKAADQRCRSRFAEGATLAQVLS